MAFQVEKETGDIVINGYENGISPSAIKGIANIKNGNISTEAGEVMASYGRVQQTVGTVTAAVVAFSDANKIVYTIQSGRTLQVGTWITVSSGIGGLSAGNYFVIAIVFVNSTIQIVQISQYYDGVILTGFSSGTATLTAITMGRPIARATESYSNGTQQYRYYVLDANGLVWVNDTSTPSAAGYTYGWFLPDVNAKSGMTGISVLNGWLIGFTANVIYAKSTQNLGGTTSASTTWATVVRGGRNAIMMSAGGNANNHFAFTGHQGRLYYTDGNYIGSIFPDTSLLTGIQNIQSFCSYTAISTTGTLTNVFTGSTPTSGFVSGESGYKRIPAVFFPAQAGTIPSGLTAGTVYYIDYNPNNSAFGVFDAITGGSAKNIASGAVGTQYFNTFYPISSDATAAQSTVTFDPQRLALPAFEVSNCMTEIGNLLIVGCKGNVLYPWNQVDTIPGSLISLPENNAVNLITVNQMAYCFAGNKGNVYITDGNTASLVIKVPDYCAGVPGTPNSYVEPVFVWGDAMYLRGRVYFSILDQTASKVGECGGVWSFVPTQNLYIGQDTGLALRLDNQNSYGTYGGVCTVLIPNQVQTSVSPQYWSGWYSDVSSPTYGIDGNQSYPTAALIVETDLMPLGTVLKKFTAKQIEYKLSVPLAAGETVAVAWRKNGTDAYTSAGVVQQPDGAMSLSGYFNANFQGAQWVQLQYTITPLFSTSTTFGRLTEGRIR